MLTRPKSPLKFVALDFLIITLLLLCAAYLVYGANRLLYSDTEKLGKITVISEPVSDYYEGSLQISDSVYDPITKRKIGEITELEIISENGKIRFLIGLDSLRTPRGNSMRTKRLWFKYQISDGDFEK